MKLAINAVTARVGGGRRHLNPFVVALADVIADGNDDSTIVVFVPPEFEVRTPHPSVEWVRVDVPEGLSLRRLWWDNVTLLRRTRHVDAIVSPLNFGPLFARRPHVLFQRNALYFDDVYFRSVPVATRFRLRVGRLLSLACVRRADSVITPTEAMADMIRPHVPSARNIHSAPHGFDVAEARAMAQRDVVERAGSWAARDVRLLHVGVPWEHKNLPTVVRTLARVCDALPDRDVGLAVTFVRDDHDPAVTECIAAFVELATDLGVLDRVTFLGSVDNPDVFPLLAAADALVYPSTSESFGIPVLEAFAVGTAVVASNIDSLAEVAGGSGFLHDPHDDEAAAAAVVAALAEDESAAAQRRARADEFSPERQAAFVHAELKAIGAAEGRDVSGGVAARGRGVRSR